jgi:uncharacterized protein YdaU (DUF1376 family)
VAEFPAMPLWTDAYLADTSHLTTTEHGAYLLLLMVAWRTHDKRLPDDDKKLARYARVTPGQWARLKPVLQEFFKVKDGYWTQGRLTDEAEAVRQHRERQSKAGKASALKRKGRHSTAVQPNGNQEATPYSYSTPNNISPKGDCASGDALKPDHVAEKWNEIAGGIGLPCIRGLTPERRQLVRARIAQYSVDDFVAVFGKVAGSPFLRGEKNWKGATFDWVMKKGNFQKILEGNYDE